MARARSLQDVEHEEFVRHVPLFADLSPAEHAQLAAALRKQRYKKHGIILHADDPGQALILLTSGLAKVTVEPADYRELIVGLLYPFDFFGEMALLDNLPRSATVTALEPSEALVLARDTFVDLLQRTPSMARHVAETLSRRIRKAMELVHSLAFLDAHARVARVVFNISLERGQTTAYGTSLDVRLTQQQLADLVGTTRETISRVLHDFQQAGYLRMTRGDITVLEPAILAGIAQASRMAPSGY